MMHALGLLAFAMAFPVLLLVMVLWLARLEDRLPAAVRATVRRPDPPPILQVPDHDGAASPAVPTSEPERVLSPTESAPMSEPEWAPSRTESVPISEGGRPGTAAPATPRVPAQRRPDQVPTGDVAPGSNPAPAA